MSFRWMQENPAYWDSGKQAIVGAAPAGIFEPPAYEPGDLVAGEWWRVEENGDVVGYGWMDTNWGGDAEVLLSVAPGRSGHGVGSFILDQLEREAAARGLNYLYNVVRPTHPGREAVTRWLERRGFVAADDGQLRRRVRFRPTD